jgi:hypothetical protein
LNDQELTQKYLSLENDEKVDHAPVVFLKQDHLVHANFATTAL